MDAAAAAAGSRPRCVRKCPATAATRLRFRVRLPKRPGASRAPGAGASAAATAAVRVGVRGRPSAGRAVARAAGRARLRLLDRFRTIFGPFCHKWQFSVPPVAAGRCQCPDQTEIRAALVAADAASLDAGAPALAARRRAARRGHRLRTPPTGGRTTVPPTRLSTRW